MKLNNFRRLDPEYTTDGKVGLTRGNKDEELVWQEFASDFPRLSAVAGAIRASVAEGTCADGTGDSSEMDVIEAVEGKALTRMHRTRERNRKLVDAKKSLVL